MQIEDALIQLARNGIRRFTATHVAEIMFPTANRINAKGQPTNSHSSTAGKLLQTCKMVVAVEDRRWQIADEYLDKIGVEFNQITELPDDHYNVLVKNKRDELSLLWLANQIGEEKLRKTALKRGNFHPAYPLFVSVILKRFHLKVPRAVFEPVVQPIYRVYVLYLCDQTAVKIGRTAYWPHRAFEFVKTANLGLDQTDKLLSLFCAERSQAFYVGTYEQSKSIETTLKTDFKESQCESPYFRRSIPYGCGGHTEWFGGECYQPILNRLQQLGGCDPITLAQALSWSEGLNSVDYSDSHH